MNCFISKTFFHFPKQYLGCKIVSIKDKSNIINLFTNCVVRFVLVIENVALQWGTTTVKIVSFGLPLSLCDTYQFPVSSM